MKDKIVNTLLKATRTLPGLALIGFYVISAVLLYYSPSIFLVWIFFITLYQTYLIVCISWFSNKGMSNIYKDEAVDWREKYETEKDGNSLNWDDIVIYCVFPNYKEDESVLKESLDALLKCPEAKTHLIPVLAMEAREDGHKEKALKIISDYQGKFKDMIFTAHPPNWVKGERPGKSSNENYAVRNLEKHIQLHGFSEDKVLITIADADSIIHKNYFSAVLCKFCTSSNRYRVTYQPPMINYLNIEKIPVFSRILSLTITAEYLSVLASPIEETIPFSTYSLSYKIAKEVDFWDPEVCAEDWHMYLKTCFKSGDDYKCESIFLPVNCYSVGEHENYWQGCKDRYVQANRHFIAINEVIYFLKQSILFAFSGKKFSFIKWFKLAHRIIYPMIYSAIGITMNTFNAVFFFFWNVVHYFNPENETANIILNSPWYYLIQLLNTISIIALVGMLLFSVRYLTKDSIGGWRRTSIKQLWLLVKTVSEYMICSPVTIVWYCFYPAVVNIIKTMWTDDFVYVVATKTTSKV